MADGNSSSRPPPRPARHRRGLTGLRPRRGWELHPGVRPDGRLSPGERAADGIRDALGSWVFVTASAVLVTVGVLVAVRHDRGVGPVAVVGLALSGVAVVELALVLLAVRRADRIAADAALYGLEWDRYATAGVDELRDEVERLRGDVARLTARLETLRQQFTTQDGQP